MLDPIWLINRTVTLPRKMCSVNNILFTGKWRSNKCTCIEIPHPRYFSIYQKFTCSTPVISTSKTKMRERWFFSSIVSSCVIKFYEKWLMSLSDTSGALWNQRTGSRGFFSLKSRPGKLLSGAIGYVTTSLRGPTRSRITNYCLQTDCNHTTREVPVD